MESKRKNVMTMAVKWLSWKLSQVWDKVIPSHRYKRYNDCYVTISRFLKYARPRIIYDIGAYKGRWSYVMSMLNENLEHIVMFEPQKKYCNVLKIEDLTPNIPKDIYNLALGDSEADMKLVGGTHSASFFDLADKTDTSVNFRSDEEEVVHVRRLDDIVKDDALPTPDLIKLDAQGYELMILRGATETLKKTRFLIVEVSFREIYKNQPLASQVIGYLGDLGFEPIDFGYEWRILSDNGKIVQMDIIFERISEYDK